MDINKRDRTELKSFFRKNSIPTESNFSDLIDAMLNQKEDGIVKLPQNPLSIEASGDAASQKKAINFYADFSDDKPAWSLSLNPRSNPAVVGDSRAGFSIGDGDGNSRLFIDAGNGAVGIGTIGPLQGRLDIDSNWGNWLFFKQRRTTSGGGGFIVHNPWKDNDDDSRNGLLFAYRNSAGAVNWDNTLYLHGPTGNVSIGKPTATPAERLDVGGRIKADKLTVGPWPANPLSYVFFGTNSLNQADAGSYALLQGASGGDTGRTFLNSPLDIRFRIANSEKMVLGNNGNLTVYNDILFGARTRQMLNLWSDDYGIGVQGGTQYYRSGAHFAWFRGGSHNDTTFNPGAGGIRMMALNNAGDFILSARTNPTNDPNKSACRALVDYDNKLIINFGNDFTGGVETGGNFIVRGFAYKPGGGSWLSVSDETLKKNIEPLQGALEKLLALRGVNFEWKDPEQQGGAGGAQIGMIAQEVEQVFPQWVVTGPDGYKAIGTQGFEALVVEAFRNLAEQIRQLRLNFESV
ncbi:MAG: tail fiber domain-containing protein [Gammaproteobacteria bacterium]